MIKIHCIMINWDEYGNMRSPARNRLIFPEHRLTWEVFVDYFKSINTDLWVLDAGCGDGFWLETLRNLGFYNLIGVDLSYPLLKRAKDKGLNVIQCNIESLDFQQKFDIILICDVLEHLPEPYKAISRLCNLLNKSGILYLIIPIYDSLYNRFKRFSHRERKIDQARAHDETHLHSFSKEDMTKLLNANHLRIERAIYTANRLPLLTKRMQRFTFGNRFGNWLSISSRYMG